MADNMADKSKRALRYNSDKPKMSLIPSSTLIELAKVLTFGASKYPANNWRTGMPFSEVQDSLLRHYTAFASGEDLDPESGLPHLGHMLCNVAFLIEYQKTRPEFDDRYKINVNPSKTQTNKKAKK